MVAACVAAYGAVDVLVNNAADVSPEVLGRDRGLAQMSVELWDRTLRVDLRSQMLACREAVPHMLAAGRGSIINVASVAGMAGDVVRPAYSAAKAGTIAMTRYLATMYGKQGIRCNAVAPGLVLGPSAERGLGPGTVDRLLDNHLTPRLGLPDDIAAAVAFLASDDAGFITGEVLTADGGALSHLPTFAQHLRAGRQA
jgi:NAD(P)-dependent dehydrogenase (short-subunit alcohol dehydrogenase family)